MFILIVGLHLWFNAKIELLWESIINYGKVLNITSSVNLPPETIAAGDYCWFVSITVSVYLCHITGYHIHIVDCNIMVINLSYWLKISHSCYTSGCKSELPARNAAIENINLVSMNKRNSFNRRSYGRRSIDCKSTDLNDPDQESATPKNLNVSTKSYKSKLSEMLNIGTSPVVPTVPMPLIYASEEGSDIRNGSLLGMVTPFTKLDSESEH
jgi:hypothetical protein